MFSLFLLKATVSTRLKMPKQRVQYKIYRKYKFPSLFLYSESARVQYERAIKRTCQEHLKAHNSPLTQGYKELKSSAIFVFSQQCSHP